MGGEFGAEDERVITRLVENALFTSTRQLYDLSTNFVSGKIFLIACTSNNMLN